MYLVLCFSPNKSLTLSGNAPLLLFMNAREAREIVVSFILCRKMARQALESQDSFCLGCIAIIWGQFTICFVNLYNIHVPIAIGFKIQVSPKMTLIHFIAVSNTDCDQCLYLFSLASDKSCTDVCIFKALISHQNLTKSKFNTNEKLNKLNFLPLMSNQNCYQHLLSLVGDMCADMCL